MPRDNVESVRQAFAHWRAGDYVQLTDFFLANSTPGVELCSRFGAVSGQTYRGHDGVRAWLNDIEESFEHFEPWADDLRAAAGDRVVATGGVRFRAKGTGVDMTQPMGWVYEFRDGRLDRMLFYPSPGDALEAAGLPGAAGH